MLAFFFGDNYSLALIARHYWLIFPAAFAVALIATPLCRRLALCLGVVDYPDNHVKTHTEPTAYLGGIGMLLGLLAGLIIGAYILRQHQQEVLSAVKTGVRGFAGRYPNWLILAGVGFGATIACLVGVLDDLLDLKPWQKFLGQALAATVLIAVGVRPNLAHLFYQVNINLPPILDFLLGLPLVMLFVLGATNSLNLLDGLDGLCAGVTAIITIAFLLLALTLASWAHSPVGDPVRLVVCLALAGATLGFLPMNRHPARIFMGDAGSMLLGFVAAALMTLFTEQFGRWSVAAIIIFGLPILDTAVALVRRFINKRPLFVSDRGHIYDQLMDRGLGLKKTVALSYVLATAYALLGLIVSQMRFRYAVIAFLAVIVISALIIWRAGFLHAQRTAPPANQSP